MTNTTIDPRSFQAIREAAQGRIGVLPHAAFNVRDMVTGRRRSGLLCRFSCGLAWNVPGDVVVAGSAAQRARDAHELDEHGGVFGASGSDLTRPHRRRLTRVGSAVS